LFCTGCHKPVASTDDTPAPELAANPTPDYAPPGTFYLLTTVRKETKDGVSRLLPGTEVRQLRPGRYRTPEGEMALDAKILTNDRTMARAAAAADQTHQALVAPKYASTAPAPGASPRQMPPNPSFNATAKGGQQAADKASAVTSLKFSLTNLQRKQAGLQKELATLQGQSAHRHRVSATGPDIERVNGELQQVQAQIDDVSRKIADAER
jgi:hypothetical protein